MIETDQLLFERREPVASITFNRPEAHNAMTRLEVAPLREVADWVEQYRRFWEQSFDRLDDYLHELRRRENEDGEQ
jgi:hypothetical protein